MRKLLSIGVIQPRQSPYSILVLLVRKPTRSWRMCVECRALNKVTVKDNDSISVVEELLEEVNHFLSWIYALVITRSE